MTKFSEPDCFVQIKDALLRAVELIDDLYNEKPRTNGVLTGFSRIDHRIGGVNKGDLMVIGSRPAMGSASLILTMALHAAIDQKKSVLIMGGDYSACEIAQRMIASVGCINRNSLRCGQLNEDDWTRLCNAVEQLIDAKIVINQGYTLSPEKAYASVKQLAGVSSIDLIVVDSVLSLFPKRAGVTIHSLEYYPGALEVLKQMAVDFDVAVLTRAYLPLEADEEAHKRRYSIENFPTPELFIEYADLIGIIYRHEVYFEDSTEEGLADFDVCDLRDGRAYQTAWSKLKNRLEYCRYEETASS